MDVRYETWHAERSSVLVARIVQRRQGDLGAEVEESFAHVSLEARVSYRTVGYWMIAGEYGAILVAES